jgi:alanine racemase
MRHSSYLEVNLDLLGQNFERIQSLAPKAEVLPMVKSDAYGNGIIPISEFLVREHKVKTLGCASLGEALHLLKSSPGLKAQLLVFSDNEIQNEKLRQSYLDHNIVPVLHHRSHLEVMVRDSSLFKIPLILKVNTGMNRLGLSLEDLEEYLPLLKKRGVRHLLTHFARATDLLKADDKTHRQYDEFKKMQKFLKDAGVEIEKTSVSNSGAIEQEFGINETYVRPGLMLYGPPSVLQPIIWKGHQTSRLVTKVLTSFQVKKGTPIGYGVNVADKDCFMVIIPMGYGDGLIAYGSGTKLSINGQPGKIFGRINMDMAFIQFDPAAEKDIKNEDVVELWNHDNHVITDIATQNKTIPYQLMCGISSRIPRIYKVK